MLTKNMFHPSGTLPGHEFDALSGRIIGAALAVHKALGPGFAEAAYQNAMCVALGNRRLAYETQRMIQIQFEGVEVGRYWLDLVVSTQIVVELKSVKCLADIHHAQNSGLPQSEQTPNRAVNEFQ